MIKQHTKVSVLPITLHRCPFKVCSQISFSASFPAGTRRRRHFRCVVHTPLFTVGKTLALSCAE